jgi:hypothetical protein
LLNASVILFNTIAQISVRPVLYLVAQYSACCPWIRVVPIGGYPDRLMANNILGLSEEPLCRSHIPVLTQHRVHQLAISIYRPVEVAPFAADTHVRFIDIPRVAGLASAFGAQVLCDEWGKAGFPIAYCLVSKLEAALQEHLSKVSKAEFVPQTPQYHQKYNVRWEREVIVRSSSSFVEDAAAAFAPEDRIAEGGFPGQESGRRG